jgi:hypothetical protein
VDWAQLACQLVRQPIGQDSAGHQSPARIRRHCGSRCAHRLPHQYADDETGGDGADARCPDHNPSRSGTTRVGDGNDIAIAIAQAEACDQTFVDGSFGWRPISGDDLARHPAMGGDTFSKHGIVRQTHLKCDQRITLVRSWIYRRGRGGGGGKMSRVPDG